MASYQNPGRWPTEGERPAVPGPWKAATFWQTSGGTMRVAGTIVDTDVFLGSLDELKAMASVGDVASVAQKAIETASVELSDAGHGPPEGAA